MRCVSDRKQRLSDRKSKAWGKREENGRLIVGEMKMGDIPADAVPSTTGCVLVTLRSQMPSLWPTYSLTSWHTALDVVALKLDTI